MGADDSTRSRNISGSRRRQRNGRGYPFASSGRPTLLIEESSCLRCVFPGGQFIRLGSLEGEELFDFPEPVGRSRFSTWTHEETNTLPLFIGKGLSRWTFSRSRSRRTWLTPSACSRVRPAPRLSDRGRGEVDGREVKVAPRDMLAALMPDPKTLAGRSRRGVLAVVVRGLRDGRRRGGCSGRRGPPGDVPQARLQCEQLPGRSSMADVGRDDRWGGSIDVVGSRGGVDPGPFLKYLRNTDHDRRETTCVRSRQIIDLEPGTPQGSRRPSRAFTADLATRGRRRDARHRTRDSRVVGDSPFESEKPQDRVPVVDM